MRAILALAGHGTLEYEFSEANVVCVVGMDDAVELMAYEEAQPERYSSITVDRHDVARLPAEKMMIRPLPSPVTLCLSHVG
ncbi:hypothetical protein PENSPDRAFT_652817 [Peniophora sp. CONT]|nr:hypothetical protein PENSPDRAFT_652817 [Peniophora sp. CONT]